MRDYAKMQEPVMFSWIYGQVFYFDDFMVFDTLLRVPPTGWVKKVYAFLVGVGMKITPGVSKKYPLLTGNRNETVRYHYSPSGQLNLSIFNLDPHTLHLKIGHQTLEIQACKVKIYSAPETRGFVKGPSHDLQSQACCTGISTLTFSFLHWKELYLEMLQLFYK